MITSESNPTLHDLNRTSMIHLIHPLGIVNLDKFGQCVIAEEMGSHNAESK